MSFRIRAILWTILCLPCLLHATVPAEGNTKVIRVPMVAEPWSATADHVAKEPNRIIPAPQSQQQQSQPSATTAVSTQAQSLAPQGSMISAIFPGPSDGVPPDSHIAAGPDHLVAVVNSIISIYSKTGTAISTSGLNSFFQSLPGANCGCFDSRVLYDQADRRFILSTAMRASSSNAAVLVAVSQTSDPTGNWFKYEINQSNTSWWDFPALGLSSSAIYISADEIGSTSAHWVITVIGLPELLAGNSTLNITRFDNVPQGGTPLPAITFGSSPIEYMLQAIGGGLLRLFQINTSGTPTLSGREFIVDSYSQPPPFAPQPGDASNSKLINGSDDILSLVWRNGSLWANHTVMGPNNNAVVRWYQIDPVALTVRQMGAVSGAGNASYGALTVLPDDSVDMVFTTSSATQFASAAYAHRSPSDPLGTVSVSGIYQAGSATYQVTRWGDYSGMSPDPSGNGSWGIAELAGNGVATTTSIIHIANASASGDFSLTAASASVAINAGQSATYTLSITPQNGFQGAITFSCSGLPAGAACAFNPSSITPGNALGSVQLVISTTAPRAQVVWPSDMRFAAFVAFGLPVAGLMWLRHDRRRRLHRFTLIFALLLLAAIAGMQLGCGGPQSAGSLSPAPGSNPPVTGGTPAGTSTVVILASSGNIQHSTSVTLVVH